MKKHGQCYFLTYVRPEKKFCHIFSNFWPIFRHLPPLFVALSQKVSCVTFQNYQISMYNSNTDSLGLILGVEVFFFYWSLFRSTVRWLVFSSNFVSSLFSGIFNEAQLARVDALNDGLSLILETYLMSLANPWKKIATNIDRNLLLRRRKSSKNKFVSRVDLDVNDPLRGY